MKSTREVPSDLCVTFEVEANRRDETFSAVETLTSVFHVESVRNIEARRVWDQLGIAVLRQEVDAPQALAEITAVPGVLNARIGEP